MPAKKTISREELVALFQAQATAPPPEAEANRRLARHLQCKTSVKLAAAVRDALNRYAGNDPLPLPAPSTLLPPLM
jgi:hypothetical protein